MSKKINLKKITVRLPAGFSFVRNKRGFVFVLTPFNSLIPNLAVSKYETQEDLLVNYQAFISAVKAGKYGAQTQAQYGF